jgi:hypothetical protein
MQARGQSNRVRAIAGINGFAAGNLPDPSLPYSRRRAADRIFQQFVSNATIKDIRH